MTYSLCCFGVFAQFPSMNPVMAAIDQSLAYQLDDTSRVRFAMLAVLRPTALIAAFVCSVLWRCAEDEVRFCSPSPASCASAGTGEGKLSANS